MKEKIIASGLVGFILNMMILDSGITTVRVVMSLAVYIILCISYLLPYRYAVYVGVMFVYGCATYFVEDGLLLAGMFLISIFIFFLVQRVEQLTEKLHQTRDEGVETERALKEKNNILIENQNNEIRLATMSERSRISRELHDNVGHMLSRSLILSGAIRTVNKDRTMDDKLLILENTLDDTLKEMRKTVHQIHSQSISMEENIQEIVKLLEAFEVTTQIDAIDDISENMKLSVIAILREGASNIVKHSNGTNVDIRVRRQPAFLSISIYDNGRIDATQRRRMEMSIGEGIGLRNIEERAKMLHGTANFYMDFGFKIFVNIPIEKEKQV